MLKAGALFYAIAVAVLVALLSGSLILFAYFSRMETSTYLLQEQLQRNAVSGTRYLLSSQQEIKAGDQVWLNLFDSGNDSVLLEKKAWGAYEIILSKARWNNSEVKLAALAGSNVQQEDRFALWLADQDRPLSLAGNTMIKGDAWLPKAGVQRAYIEGQSYTGSRMIYGNMRESSRTIPAFDKQVAEKMSSLVEGRTNEDDSVIATDEDSLYRSFFDNPAVVRSPGTLILSGKSYSGQVIITAVKKIVVKKDASLDNVLLAAPVIIIEENFEGTIQAFAGDTLTVGKECNLLYPSSLGIIRSARSADNMLLSVSEGTKMKGAVVSWQDTYDVRKQMLVSIDKQVEITGQVYSSGLLDLKGTVNGSVIASRFLLRTPSSVYENHLLNATIDVTKLPAQFGGVIMEKSSKIILKWME